VVSRQLLTSEFWDHSQSSAREICGEKSGIGTGFTPTTSVMSIHIQLSLEADRGSSVTPPLERRDNTCEAKQMLILRQSVVMSGLLTLTQEKLTEFGTNLAIIWGGSTSRPGLFSFCCLSSHVSS
jgi:hypothetical protein